MDETRLPRLAAYLDRLPQGLDSYPEASFKASLLRSLLAGVAFPALTPGTLPEPVAALVEAPPAVSAWIPAVHHRALVVALRDLCFESDEAFLTHAHEAQLKLYGGALYRLLFRVASPELLIRGIGYRWSAFSRGTAVQAEHRQTEGEITALYPPHLYTELGARALGEGFRAVLVANGLRARVELSSYTADRAVFAYRWT